MKLNIHTQPDDETCGPTSLHAVYSYFKDDISLQEVVRQVEMVPTGGTVAAMLACHAMARGYEAELYIYNVTFFDPSWFVPQTLTMPEIADKLREQMRHKNSERFHDASFTYLRFIQMGGLLKFVDLTPDLLDKKFSQNIPVITGLSATYLYQTSREIDTPTAIIYDDIRGVPSGHFVVLCGQDRVNHTVTVADPHCANPISRNNYYVVNTRRLINSIMLGVLTYDANLLVIKPKGMP